MVVKPETVKRVRTEAQLEGDALKSKWFADEKAEGRKPTVKSFWVANPKK